MRKRACAFLFLVFVLGAGSPGMGEADGGTRVNFSAGVCVHFETKSDAAVEREMRLIGASGVRWIRYDFRWNTIEHEEGEWDFSRYDLIVDRAARHGIHILGILDYGTFWASTAQPRAPHRTRWLPRRKPWEAFVRRVVSRYRGRVDAWEIWNEPNVAVRWRPRPDAREYVALLGEAQSAAKSANPRARIIFGGISGVDLNFLEKCFRLGALRYVDAVAFHPYGYPSPPERFFADAVSRIAALTRKYAPAPVAIWVTEIGWPTAEAAAGVSEKSQAYYLARTVLLSLMLPVERVFWYDFSDDGIAPDRVENRFGLVRHGAEKAKPAYVMLRNVLKYFGGSVVRVETDVAIEPGIRSDILAGQFYDPSRHRLLIPFWTTGGEGSVTFRVPASMARARIRMVDLLTDRTREIPPASLALLQNRIHLSGISGSPMLLEISGVSP